ncbi:ComEC/Rec2 family competence protein [Rathayibacter sp. VKM Ac-2928]|uniref:ComEC/Rec2 family competence protein n=1 Tax=Rathayibacter sp. VKM Ac-2928 TaxID=2929479 RepID=UPI001FB1B0C8|nr:ComEC/Rec2 family competence protein [Rathayibacter sp. VKM Ac-2928]MCJ1682555.1 ComEC/Rec2 family competence protein [Rathayibacter sp. VKM Ac-2928]
MIRAQDLRLLPLALSAWAAAAATGLLPVTAVLGGGVLLCTVAWSVCLVAVLALGVLRRRRAAVVLAGIAVALGGAALAVTSVVVTTPERHPPELRAAAESRAAEAVLVRVETSARPLVTGGVWFDGTALQLEDQPMSAPVRVFLAEPGGRLPVGSEVVLRARAEEPGVVGESTLLTASAVLERRPPVGVAAVAEVLRSGFLARTAVLGGDVAGLLPGLATGDTSALSSDLEDDMRTASLTHLTAVSGANCAVVVAAGWLVAALLGAGRRLRTVSALAVLAAFVVLVTPEPSVVRAAVMASVVLLARLGRRSGAAVPALLASVVLLMLVDPAIAGRLGFVLSVLATGGLLLAAEPIADRLGDVLPRPLALVVAVPLAAQLACQPAVLLIDPSIPVYGVLANLLAEPAAPVGTGLGLIGCLLAPWWPGGADVAIRLAAVPAWWIASIARAVATWPSPRIAWLPGLGGMLALMVLTVLALLLVTRSRRLTRARQVAATVLAGALVVGGASSVATPLLRSGAVPSDWRVAMCDIGQGDAVLVRGDAGVVLVDTGPLPERLDACLDLLGIDRLALLLLTHYDLDHVGGLAAVVGRVDEALVGPVADEGDTRDRADLVSGGAAVQEAARGDSGSVGSLRWRVVWPERGTTLRGNEASVTLRIDIPADAIGGPLSLAMLGDLGAEEQGRLARLDPGRVDVVKVAHHGSADQSPALYDALGARTGLVSVGADNTYGHPTPSLLALLAERGTRALRTDLEGTVLLSSRPEGVVVWTSGAAAQVAALDDQGGAITPVLCRGSPVAGEDGAAGTRSAGVLRRSGQRGAADRSRTSPTAWIRDRRGVTRRRSRRDSEGTTRTPEGSTRRLDLSGHVRPRGTPPVPGRGASPAAVVDRRLRGRADRNRDRRLLRFPQVPTEVPGEAATGRSVLTARPLLASPARVSGLVESRVTEGRRHGRQSPGARQGGPLEGGDPAARVGPDATRSDRADHRSRAVPRR